MVIFKSGIIVYALSNILQLILLYLAECYALVLFDWNT